MSSYKHSKNGQRWQLAVNSDVSPNLSVIKWLHFQKLLCIMYTSGQQPSHQYTLHISTWATGSDKWATTSYDMTLINFDWLIEWLIDGLADWLIAWIVFYPEINSKLAIVVLLILMPKVLVYGKMGSECFIK